MAAVENLRQQIRALATSSNRLEACKALLHSMLEESLGMVASRQLLTDFSALLEAEVALPTSQRTISSSDLKEMCRLTLEAVQARAAAFEDQLSNIRQTLAQQHENDEEWAEAASVLMAIPLESGHRTVTDDTRLQIYLKIAALLLENDDAVQADAYVSRASALVASTKLPHLELQFKAHLARIQDSKRKFLEAARRYYELSLVADAGEAAAILTCAVNCAVLAPAGQPRARMLATLFKDERTRALPSFGILEAMYLDRIVRGPQLDRFAATLKDHQRALTSDGTTILARAIVQHNMLASSRLYTAISFTELAALLQTTPDRAETVAVAMIREGRMAGSIDQVAGLLCFSEAAGRDMRSWETRVHDLCVEVNDALEAVRSSR